MSRRSLLNVALLAAVLLLGAVLYFAPGPEEDAQVRLTALDRAEIQRIDVLPEGGKPISFERRSGHWQMTSPLSVPAQEVAVRRLLSLLGESATGPLEPAAVGDGKRFGLAPPKAIVEFDGTRVAFGGTNPLGNRRYVHTSHGLFLIPDAHLYILERGIYGLIDTRLLPPDAAVASLRLDALAMERIQGGQWKLSPPGDGASADQMLALVRRWEQASALRVSAAEGESQAPAGNITIALQDGQRLHFRISATQPELVLTRPDLDIAYHLPASQAERLLKLPEPSPP